MDSTSIETKDLIIVDRVLTFNGIWTPSNVPQIVALDRTIDQMKTLYGDMWNQNMRLIDLQAYESKTGQVLYNGVWNPGSYAQLVMWGAALPEFEAKYGEMWNQNMRLICQQAFTVNGQTFFNGVWNPGNHGQFVSWNKTVDQINAQYGEMWNQNMRLIDLQAYWFNGQVLYNGVWNPGNYGQVVVWNWALQDFESKYGEMWNQNMRLICQQAVNVKAANVENDVLLYLGVWNPSSSGQFVRWNTPMDQFSAVYGEWRNRNFRLLDMDIYWVDKR